jgi:hypothetical protein
VMNMKERVRPVDPSSIGITNRRIRSLSMKVVNLLTVRDAGERSVLATDKHAGVQHDRRPEACLALCDTERGEKLGALDCRLVGPRKMRRWMHLRTLGALDRSLSVMNAETGSFFHMSGMLGSALEHLSAFLRSPRAARSAKYSSVRNADTFSADELLHGHAFTLRDLPGLFTSDG